MSYLASLLEYGLYVLLGLSAVTVLAFAVFLVRNARRDPKAIKPQAITAYIGAATSIGGLVIGILNLIHPIGLLPKPDPGEIAIKQFFQAVTRKEWDSAMALIHPDRITEIRRTIPNFGSDTLEALYRPVMGFDDLKVKAAPEEGVGARTYSVAVDAQEVWPQSSFYVKQLRSLGDAIREGLISEEGTVTVILRDLKAHYDVPESVVPRIRRMLLTRKWESIFSPAFTYELRRDLRSEEQIELPTRVNPAAEITVRRHFVFNLRVADSGGPWKIRAGLSDPPLIAPYRQKSAWSR